MIAHIDRVPQSPGANDNGSGVAVLVEALQRIRKNPPKNIRARFFFADEEEKGLEGSEYHLKNMDPQKIVAVFNFDMVGMGEHVFVSSGKEKLNTSDLASTAAKAVLTELGIPFSVEPWAFSDHSAFLEMDIPAVGFMTSPGSDIENIRTYLNARRKSDDEHRWRTIAEARAHRLFLQNLEARSKVFRTYHSKHDLPKTLNEETLQQMAALVEGVIERMEQYHRH